MKTHIISLEPYDDFISIRDKIKWSKTPRILLVWPDQGRVRLLDMDLKLIYRQADELGAQIALVSDDVIIAQKAQSLGIPVFSSIPEAQKKPWRKPVNQRKKLIRDRENVSKEKLRDQFEYHNSTQPKLSKTFRLVVFLLGLLAVFALIGLFIPEAEVDLQPEKMVKSIEFDAWTNEDIDTVNISGALPSTIGEIVVTRSLEKESTGSVKIPSRNATGQVTFTNLTNREIIIPVGTVVRTVDQPIVRFATTTEVILPAGVDEELDSDVICLSAGTIGNMPGGVITAVEGEIGGSVEVVNLEPISGGVDTKATAPSEKDYEDLSGNLEVLLLEDAFNSFKEKYPENDHLLLKETIELEEIIQEERFPEVDIPADHLRLSMQAQYSIRLIYKRDIQTLSEKIVLAGLQNGEEIEPEKFQFTIISPPLIDPQGTIRWRMEISYVLHESIDIEQIKNQLANQRLVDAVEFLEEKYRLRGAPRIKVTPAFLKVMPFLPIRISVRLDG